MDSWLIVAIYLYIHIKHIGAHKKKGVWSKEIFFSLNSIDIKRLCLIGSEVSAPPTNQWRSMWFSLWSAQPSRATFLSRSISLVTLNNHISLGESSYDDVDTRLPSHISYIRNRSCGRDDSQDSVHHFSVFQLTVIVLLHTTSLFCFSLPVLIHLVSSSFPLLVDLRTSAPNTRQTCWAGSWEHSSDIDSDNSHRSW